jgi:hypothetical protein
MNSDNDYELCYIVLVLGVSAGFVGDIHTEQMLEN